MDGWRRRLGAVVGTAVIAGVVLLGSGTASAAAIYAPVDQEQLDRYCRSEGFAQASLRTGNAYGWRCDGPSGGRPVDMDGVCQASNRTPTPRISRLTDFHNPYGGWECWNTASSVPRAAVGADDLAAYCRGEGYVGAQLVDSTAYGWRCTSSGSTTYISMRKVCQSILLGSVSLIDRVANYHDPYSWKCYQ